MGARPASPDDVEVIWIHTHYLKIRLGAHLLQFCDSVKAQFQIPFQLFEERIEELGYITSAQ